MNFRTRIYYQNKTAQVRPPREHNHDSLPKAMADAITQGKSLQVAKVEVLVLVHVQRGQGASHNQGAKDAN